MLLGVNGVAGGFIKKLQEQFNENKIFIAGIDTVYFSCVFV